MRHPLSAFSLESFVLVKHNKLWRHLQHTFFCDLTRGPRFSVRAFAGDEKVGASRTTVLEESAVAVTAAVCCVYARKMLCGHLKYVVLFISTTSSCFPAADQALAPQAVQKLEEAREDRLPRLRWIALRCLRAAAVSFRGSRPKRSSCGVRSMNLIYLEV